MEAQILRVGHGWDFELSEISRRRTSVGNHKHSRNQNFPNCPKQQYGEIFVLHLMWTIWNWVSIIVWCILLKGVPGFLFELVLPRRTYFLIADKEEEVQGWIKSISMLLQGDIPPQEKGKSQVMLAAVLRNLCPMKPIRWLISWYCFSLR